MENKLKEQVARRLCTLNPNVNSWEDLDSTQQEAWLNEASQIHSLYLSKFKEIVGEMIPTLDLICAKLKDAKYIKPCDEISCSKCESLSEIIYSHSQQEILEKVERL